MREIATPERVYVALCHLIRNLPPANSVAALTLRVRPDKLPTVTLVLNVEPRLTATQTTHRFELVDVTPKWTP